MKLVWKNQTKREGGGKKRSRSQSIYLNPNLPFGAEEDEGGGDARNSDGSKTVAVDSREDDPRKLVESFQSQGNQLAENGRYREALGKWEAALTLMPENAILHEQKAQVLLEIGDAWNALKAATRISTWNHGPNYEEFICHFKSEVLSLGGNHIQSPLSTLVRQALLDYFINFLSSVCNGFQHFTFIFSFPFFHLGVWRLE
uniref:Tetratricopeptide repeat protein 33 isoform X1 n=1 Tax=Elaeis guineensis var. tenera TaxID=51953 RepID=A0A8N4F8F5_ELAGV|nr:tetratricopeptide repeat protein 33 isoform X1 [Elaeis guineensis]